MNDPTALLSIFVVAETSLVLWWAWYLFSHRVERIARKALAARTSRAEWDRRMPAQPEVEYGPIEPCGETVFQLTRESAPLRPRVQGRDYPLFPPTLGAAPRPDSQEMTR